jgi:adenylate kinase family enzyme
VAADRHSTRGLCRSRAVPRLTPDAWTRGRPRGGPRGAQVTRADDTEEALVKRLEMFRENRDAVAAAFASIAVEVDGNRAPDVIAEEIGTTLG